MDLLLDTHAFIWFDLAPEKLSTEIRRQLLSAEHRLYLSVVSIWEMQIKQQLGKLSLGQELAEAVSNQQDKNDVQILSLKPEHIYHLSSLANHHQDPFDRLLIAQAKTQDYHLVTRDKAIRCYVDEVNVLW